MVETVTAKDYDRALIAPEQVFASPMAVVETDSLTPEQKLKVLKHWEANARDIQTATAENMGGPGLPGLDDVKDAITKLMDTEKIDETTIV